MKLTKLETLAKETCVTDPIPLMVKYLDGKPMLTNDEREILLFALYLESKSNNGLAVQGAKALAENVARYNAERNKAAVPQVEARREIVLECAQVGLDACGCASSNPMRCGVYAAIFALASEAPKPLTCNCGEVATEHCNVHGDHLEAPEPPVCKCYKTDDYDSYE